MGPRTDCLRCGGNYAITYMPQHRTRCGPELAGFIDGDNNEDNYIEDETERVNEEGDGEEDVVLDPH